MNRIREAGQKVAADYGVTEEEYWATVAGQVLGYLFYRKLLGAPRWAAYGFSAIQANLMIYTKGRSHGRR